MPSGPGALWFDSFLCVLCVSAVTPFFHEAIRQKPRVLGQRTASLVAAELSEIHGDTHSSL